MKVIALPKRKRGRQSGAAKAQHQDEVEIFCQSIRQIQSTLDFEVSARGWCHILEEHGLTKGEFDDAERLINRCRKDGLLPLDICSEDGRRAAENVEEIDNETVVEFAEDWIEHLLNHVPTQYRPVSFWEDQEFYVEMAVEKVDLKSLFSPICTEYPIAITNIVGWACLNSRAAMMRRFRAWERKGKRCVLLYCGDHDPGGLQISGFLRSNLADMAGAVGWAPDHLVIDRFGLNDAFIEEHGLSWIENLETSSGNRLDLDPNPPEYVRSYIERFGVRKVEANALVTRPEAGRELCRQAIRKYIPDSAISEYREQLRRQQELARGEIRRLVTRSAA